MPNTNPIQDSHSQLNTDQSVEIDTSSVSRVDSRYDDKKKTGSSYTPTGLARFVAKQILKHSNLPKDRMIRVLDPATGDGELLLAIADELAQNGYKKYSLHGFDTNVEAIELAIGRLRQQGQVESIDLKTTDFLTYVLDCHTTSGRQTELFDARQTEDKFDVVIANPPYVRTQILGADQSKRLAESFGLSGRTDLYHAFILAIADVLKDGGQLGIIVSNRFMTTKSGLAVRQCFLDRFFLHHVYDLGDTKLFDEAVLPAVVICERGPGSSGNDEIPFTRSHSTKYDEHVKSVASILNPIDDGYDGIVRVGEVTFEITQGVLESGESHADVWRVSTEKSSEWLKTVRDHTFCCFRDIGKIRVGVKTTADKTFINRDWGSVTDGKLPEDEVLRDLLTHKEARRWKANCENQARILYTHEVVDGKRRSIDFSRYPNAEKYLESQRDVLENRKYVIKAGRDWYEIWVPQDPRLWSRPKLVFRDIAEYSTFFLDEDGSVINGDCYWMIVENEVHPDILWLAMAVGNSSFILKFYDDRFHNKLYANRRRFMTQYVEQFPIPNPNEKLGQELISLAKKAYTAQGTDDDSLKKMELLLDKKVWKSFGLVEE